MDGWMMGREEKRTLFGRCTVLYCMYFFLCVGVSECEGVRGDILI